MADGNSVLGEVASLSVGDRAAGLPSDAAPAVAVKSVYLAHPFAKKAEIEANFQPILEAVGLSVINPFQRGEQAIYDKVLAPGGGGLTAAMCDDIVRMDLEKIDATDGVVAALIDDGMIGTIMEIFYASYDLNKPVFAYTAGRKRETEHPWIRNLCIVCPSQEALIANLKGWINGRIS